MKFIIFTFSICFFICFASTAQQNALNFDGVNDHIVTAVNGVTGNSARTIEARIKTTTNANPSTSGTQKVLVDWGTFVNGGRCTFNLLWSNAIRLEIGGTGLSGTIPVNDGNWHHVACVIDPTAANPISLYVDGVLDIAGTLTSAITTGAGQIRIGRRIDGLNPFQGEMDEVRVWNVARTHAQIAANMNNELCNFPSSLILYCPLNEGIAGGTNTSVSTAANHAANNGTCTLTNFSLSGASSNWVSGFAHGPGFIIGGISTVSSCGTYTWPANGQFYPNSGFYETNVLASTGCDSIIGLNLTVNLNTFSSQAVTECETYTWPLNGQTYTSSGVYVATIPNAAGCDSLINLVLNILDPSFAIDDITACEQYTWPVNGQTYFGTTSVTDTTQSAQGCDSIVSLNLTILGPTFGMETITSCGEYFWPLNSTTYPFSGSWDATLTNSQGCDSIVTLNLTVMPFDISVVSTSPTTIVANQLVAQYQWINCVNNAPIPGETSQTFVATTAGTYAVIVTINNCSDTSDCINLANAGLTENLHNLFSLSPNPNDGKLVLASHSDISGVLRVVDAQGKEHYSQIVTQEQTVHLNLEELTAGIYFIQIVSEKGKETLRFSKY